MENYMDSSDSMANFSDQIQKLYPDSYIRIYPHVQYMVDSMNDENLYNLTNNDIDRLSDEAIRRSSILNDPPRGHNRETIRDLTRFMFIRDLHDRFRRRRFSPPFFFFPFDDFDRRRDFDFDRDRGHRK